MSEGDGKVRWVIILSAVLLLSGLVSGYHGSVAWTNIIVYASLIAFVVKFGLALWIMMRNPYAKVNKYFFIVFLGQAVWDLGKFLMWMTVSSDWAFFWAKVSYTGYIVSVFYLLTFVWSYLKTKNFLISIPMRIFRFTLMASMLAGLWLGNWVISDIVSPDALAYGFGIELWSYTWGPLYNYFFLWFQIIPFIYAFIHFVFKYFWTHRPDKKKQLMYLVIGSAFPIMIGIPTGVVLPAMGIALPPHNNILSLIMSVFIAIGIIKYKFLAVQPVGEKIVAGRKLDRKLADKYRIEFGHSYFIKHEKSSEIAHKVLLTHLYKKRYGLIITAKNPSNIRHEYGIETTPIVWLTDTDTEHPSVDPIDIEQLHETIRMFVKQVPNSVVLLDGLDYLLVHNNFSKMLHFVRQVKGMMSRTDDCFMVTKGALELDAKQEKMLEQEFLVLPVERKMKIGRGERTGVQRRPNYIVVGHNPLAQSIINEFEQRCIVPTVVEKKDILVHYPRGAINLIKGDPLSRKVLEHAGIEKPNTIVLITMEDDSEIILCINKMRQLSDSAKIITNIHNQDFISIAMKAGADRVIPSSALGGRLISLALTSPDIVRWVMDATTLSEKELELVELKADRKSHFVGKKIQQVDAELGRAGNVIAVRNIDGLKQIPDDRYAIREGDKLIMVMNLTILPRGKNLPDRIKKWCCKCKVKVAKGSAGKKKVVKTPKKKVIKRKVVKGKAKKK